MPCEMTIIWLDWLWKVAVFSYLAIARIRWLVQAVDLPDWEDWRC